MTKGGAPEAEAILEETLSLRAADETELTASLFIGDGAAASSPAVIVACATGVKRSFYAPFARYLASRGWRAATLDYRGIGDSAPKDLREIRQAPMQAWAEQDLSALVKELQQRYPQAPLGWVGHSFGGQALGLVAGGEEVRAAAFVAAQSGDWRRWPKRHWPRLWLFLYLLLPLVSRWKGYFPARALGMGENLPEGVARQWARWCRQRDYLMYGEEAKREKRAERFAKIQGTLRAYSFSDDFFAPEAPAAALLSWYRGVGEERRTHRHLKPQDLGRRSIGHFGPFRDALKDTLWREIADFLEQELQA